MTEEEFKAHERIVAINKFSEEFRGWQDEVPHFPDEIKVINITTEVYKSQMLNSKTPWIMSFIKREKSQEHLKHSEELYVNLQLLADEFQGEVRFGIVDI